jgi:hypothetical protein
METQVTKNNAPATINGLLAQENIKKLRQV